MQYYEYRYSPGIATKKKKDQYVNNDYNNADIKDNSNNNDRNLQKSESMYSTKRKVNYVQIIETVSFDFETIADFELWTYLQNNNFVLGKART